ncbi:unnamed protein product [Victoria cruziana]
MSTVDKMLIKGIRSFSPENKHVITFYKPLTLIVGPNGAGKTTIIECLKHACTGELPPNARSGHSFIHDPKVAGETETKGQIKLRFKTAAGKDVVCIRSFQLTQKASKMEYKAIESVLQTVNPHTGEKVCLSYRCADMDREVSALMGVSKAILENVIFVHQDEANWPLQDPSTLKKKFDDIFSATRYTKALEVIKKLHKDQTQEIKMYRLKLENLQTLKDAALKLRESIAQDQERAESVKAQILQLEQEIQVIETKIQQTETTLKDLRKLQDEINANATKRSTLFKLQQSQLAALAEENEDTDEELTEWQTKFQERIALLQSKISKLERDAEDATTMSTFLSKGINDYIRETGKLQAEAEAHLSLRHDRDATIQRIVVQHNLGSAVCVPISDEVAINITNQATARLKDLQKDASAKKETNDVELKGLWKNFESVSSRCSEIEGQKMAKLEKKSDILKRMKGVDEELGVLQLCEVDVSRIDAKEKLLEAEVQKRTLQVAERDFESNIQQKKTQIFSLDHKIKSLYREKDVIASDSEDRVKLGFKKEELDGCKRRRAKIMDEYTNKIKAVLKGKVPSDKDLKREITCALSALRKEHDDISAKSTEAEKKMKLVEMKIQDAKDNLLKLQKDMESKRKYIGTKLQSLVQGPVDVDAFPTVLQEAMEKRDVQKSEYSMANGMRQMFDPFERVARAHHYCPCCERPFSPEEENEFVRKQRVKNTNSMEGLKLLAISSSNADVHFQQLDKLRTVYEEYVKLSAATIPSTEGNLKELAEELQNKIVAFEDLVGVVAQARAEKDLLENLIQPVENADRLWQEMQSLQRQVDDLEYKLDVRSQGAKTLELIQTELNNLQETRENLSRQLENLQEEQRHMNNDLSNLQMRWHASREEKLQASNKLIRVKNLAEELDRISEQKSQLDFDEQMLAEAFVPLSKEKDKLLKNYEELKIKFEHECDDRVQILRNFQQEVGTLTAFASKIKQHVDSRKDEKLKELQEKQTLAESQLQQCENRKQKITAELQKSKELLHKQDQLKRNIDDNLNYRTTKAEVDELTHEIESLEQEVVKIGGFPAYEADLKRQMQEKERLLSEVVMQTGDAELEMRGRCSAGQKVLASLIIRLALAETFCLNCGILALDEPTTNLDGPNSESLASALLRIMEDRKSQENFQLIVITHDERFAQLIGQRQHAERYYRISKDELQHSIIESQDIFD